MRQTDGEWGVGHWALLFSLSVAHRNGNSQVSRTNGKLFSPAGVCSCSGISPLFAWVGARALRWYSP